MLIKRKEINRLHCDEKQESTGVINRLSTQKPRFQQAVDKCFSAVFVSIKTIVFIDIFALLIK
mgnify:CR=1 FL=1